MVLYFFSDIGHGIVVIKDSISNFDVALLSRNVYWEFSQQLIILQKSNCYVLVHSSKLEVC